MRISLWLVDSTRAARIHGSLTAADDRRAIYALLSLQLVTVIAPLYSTFPNEIKSHRTLRHLAREMNGEKCVSGEKCLFDRPRVCLNCPINDVTERAEN